VTTGPRWRKSSYSATGSDCVEVAPTAEQILMRNSKRPDEGTIAFPPDAFRALLASVKDGERGDLA
jgi:hypothetical protein